MTTATKQLRPIKFQHTIVEVMIQQRKKLRIPQRTVAHHLGKSQTFISLIERQHYLGKPMFTAPIFEKWCNVLGLHPSTLMHQVYDRALSECNSDIYNLHNEIDELKEKLAKYEAPAKPLPRKPKLAVVA